MPHPDSNFGFYTVRENVTFDTGTFRHPGTKTTGHLDTSIPGHQDTWTPGHLDNRTLGHQDTWTPGHLGHPNGLYSSNLNLVVELSYVRIVYDYVEVYDKLNNKCIFNNLHLYTIRT